MLHVHLACAELHIAVLQVQLGARQVQCVRAARALGARRVTYCSAASVTWRTPSALCNGACALGVRQV